MSGMLRTLTSKMLIGMNGKSSLDTLLCAALMILVKNASTQYGTVEQTSMCDDVIYVRLNAGTLEKALMLMSTETHGSLFSLFVSE